MDLLQQLSLFQNSRLAMMPQELDARCLHQHPKSYLLSLGQIEEPRYPDSDREGLPTGLKQGMMDESVIDILSDVFL